MEDTGNFLGSPDLITYAVQRGWFDAQSGESFNFRKAYRKNRNDPPDSRRWRGRQLAAACQVSWPPKEPDRNHPDGNTLLPDSVCHLDPQKRRAFLALRWLIIGYLRKVSTVFSVFSVGF